MPSLNILRHDDIFRANPTATEPPPPKPYRRLLPLLLKAIVMLVIISLFFLFMGIAAFAALHLLIPTGAFRALHRRRRLADPGYPSGAAVPPEELLKFLPLVKFAAGMAETDCAVCLENFKEGDWCRSLPDCRHLFHANCVDKWLTKAANCPICRARVRLNSGATNSEMGEDECNFWLAVGF
ncbi:RING-H2 finger protein ATL56-like [Diospyros lotus]|uniref:RING-H2 finger protein ATL56-like n=1 Tax=Diospyros lotus TaxID=55363 RepID=UPI002250A99C|nr:RING-H2 finger protein ATL56-like [Diospyros lotus]